MFTALALALGAFPVALIGFNALLDYRRCALSGRDDAREQAVARFQREHA